MTTTPNCCANCVKCSRLPPPVCGTYIGGEKYWCSQFQTVVNPSDENCKVHVRYVPKSPKKDCNLGDAD